MTAARIRDDVRVAVARDVAESFDGLGSVLRKRLDPGTVLAFVDQAVMPLHDRLVEEISDQAAALRERNRLYGKASETIGRLRAEVARLRMERAEWRGTVNGDVLVEVLAASAPEGWTPEDRRRHADDVIAAMQASGIEVRRAARPWTPEPGGLALIPRPGGPEGAGMLVRIDRITEHGNYTWDSVDGKVVGASAPSALRPAPESVVDGGR